MMKKIIPPKGIKRKIETFTIVPEDEGRQNVFLSYFL